MSGIDIGHLKSWVGAKEEASEIVTPQLVQRYIATFDGALAAVAGAPLGLHWCLAPAAAPTGALGEDGHPRKEGSRLLPPVPLPRRMWAGGEVNFLDEPIRTGDTVTRRSRVADVAHKQGKSGDLVFVTVQHEILTDRGLAINERQDIVYREAAVGPTPRAPAPAPRPADVSEEREAGPTLLFRYSALTFNAHRIHYDRDYATGVEHYDGLVVHGPLQAACLMNFAARLSPGRRLHKVEYRGVAPLTEGRFTLNAVTTGSAFDLWSADATGRPTMDMKAFLDAV